MLKIPLRRVDRYYSPGWGVLGLNAHFSCVPWSPLHPDVRTVLLRSRPPPPFRRLGAVQAVGRDTPAPCGRVPSGPCPGKLWSPAQATCAPHRRQADPSVGPVPVSPSRQPRFGTRQGEALVPPPAQTGSAAPARRLPCWHLRETGLPVSLRLGLGPRDLSQPSCPRPSTSRLHTRRHAPRGVGRGTGHSQLSRGMRTWRAQPRTSRGLLPVAACSLDWPGPGPSGCQGAGTCGACRAAPLPWAEPAKGQHLGPLMGAVR